MTRKIRLITLVCLWSTAINAQATPDQSITVHQTERTAKGRPLACSTLASERPEEAGCYTTTIAPLGRLPDAPLYWHIQRYPTREAANAARGPRGTTVD